MCGAVLVPSETSQTRVWVRSSLTWIGSTPYRTALVISSLRMSSVPKPMSSRPHSSSLRAQARRTGETADGSRGTSHSATRSGVRIRVRATMRATSSSGRQVNSDSMTASQVASGGRAGPPRVWPSVSSAASMSRSRQESRPSVKSTSRDPSGTVSSAVSIGRPAPRPSGGDTGGRRNVTVPSGSATASGGWPAVAAVTRPDTES